MNTTTPRRRPAAALGLACLAALRLAGCVATGGPAAPQVTPAMLDVSPGSAATLTDLETGRDLYINRCSECHDLYRASRYDARGWAKIMPEMSREAKLNEDQARLIETYLVAASAYARSSAARAEEQ